jgi:solute carrier family 25 carnitine/acylcarnitine transporter 20/29
VVGQPFDVVKVRYQTPAYSTRYASTFGAIGAILKEEGVSRALLGGRKAAHTRLEGFSRG